MDIELQRFKRDIDLVAFAESVGYVVDRRESSPYSVAMRAADKIVITTDASDGHAVYFTIGRTDDCGSIIDFAQRRLGGSLGDVRRRLRAWIAGASLLAYSPRVTPSPSMCVALPSCRGTAAVSNERWAAMPPYTGAYLGGRGISNAAVRAFGTRQDLRGNACVPHTGSDGSVCGWEIKNRGFTGFSAGGVKALALARFDNHPTCRIVVAESGIDAMSCAELFHIPGTMYASTAGSLSRAQRTQILQVLTTYPGAELVLATDADLAGDEIASQLTDIARGTVAVSRARPAEGKDWNDTLQAYAGRCRARGVR